MPRSSIPIRSALYIPASRQSALDKIGALAADLFILDLEDAVAPDEKERARLALTAHLVPEAANRKKCLVRINGLDTDWGPADLGAMREIVPHAVVVPKVSTPDDLVQIRQGLGKKPQIWAMIETCVGVSNVAAIARSPDLNGIIIGTNDLAAEIGCATGGGRWALMAALQSILLAARAAEVPCLDGVYNAFRDREGFEQECQQGNDLGMEGKTLIHPSQIDIANRIFAPTEVEIASAKQQVDAYEAALSRGEAVAVVDGKIIEALHVATAQNLLKRARIISEQEEN